MFPEAERPKSRGADGSLKPDGTGRGRRVYSLPAREAGTGQTGKGNDA